MTTHVDPTEPTQTPELPPEVFAELLVEACVRHILSLEGIARLAYAAGAKAGAKGEYQLGADAELEACCEWLERDPYGLLTQASRGAIAGILRAARRPKPPNLKEQALEEFEELIHNGIANAGVATILRAIKSIPDPQ